MARTAVIVTRTLDWEAVPTSAPGIEVLYTRWQDDAPNTFNSYTLTTAEVKSKTRSMSSPVLANVKKRRPYFLTPESIAEANKTGRFYDPLTSVWKPRVWGEAPPSSHQFYWLEGDDMDYLNQDGTYAVTTIGMSECLRYWTKIPEEIVTIRNDYYVPGNGYMRDFTYTFSQAEFTRWKEKQRSRALYELIPFLGLNMDDYRRPEALVDYDD